MEKEIQERRKANCELFLLSVGPSQCLMEAVDARDSRIGIEKEVAKWVGGWMDSNYLLALTTHLHHTTTTTTSQGVCTSFHPNWSYLALPVGLWVSDDEALNSILTHHQWCWMRRIRRRRSGATGEGGLN